MKEKPGYEILYEDSIYSPYLDTYYDYVIVSYYTHPCAYINIPFGHPFYEKKYDKIPVECHFGLTYSSGWLLEHTPDEKSGWWIGWDYAHYTDYAPYYSEAEVALMNLHKWTTEEVAAEAREVIQQLINKER